MRRFSVIGLLSLLVVSVLACTQPEPTSVSTAVAPTPKPISTLESTETIVGSSVPTAASTPATTTTPTPAAIPTSTTTVTPTPVPTPTPEPPSASFSVNVESGSAPLKVNFDNSSQGPITSTEWDFGDGTTSTDQSPAHRYTIAGTYNVELTITGPGGADTHVMPDVITVEPGLPALIAVSPLTVTLAVQERTQFTAVARDKFGNVVSSTFNWALDGKGGSISGDGLFTADKVAGVFTDTVSASLQADSVELIGSASITVEPGPLSRVVVEPAEVALDIGATQRFTFLALDQFGNEITDALSSWSAAPELGKVDANGLLTAGTKSGIFIGGVRVDVVEGANRASATADLGIRPGPLARVEVKPAYVFVERRASQKFDVSGFDQYGNVVRGLAFLWEAEGGSITQRGHFTAGEESGSYAVKAAAKLDNISSAGSATVLVSPYMNSSYELQKASIQVERYGIRPRANRGFVHAVGYADFDRDGDIDVLMSSGGSSPNRRAMEFYRGSSGSYTLDNSIFAEAVPGMVHPRKMLIGDYNKDGWPDAFVIGTGDDQPPWPGEYPILLLSDGQGKLVATPYDQVISFQHGGASADIDHDDDLDIFVIDNQSNSFFLMNDGTGVFSYDTDRVPSGASGFTAELIDVDGDGSIDLVTAGHEFRSHPVVIFWGETGGNYSDDLQTTLPTVACWGTVIDIEAEDLDGDGDRDIVLNRTSGGCDTFYKGFYIQVLRNDGNRTFTDATDTMIVDGSSPTDRWIDWLRVQDINGDGKLELIADDASIGLIWIDQDGILRRSESSK